MSAAAITKINEALAAAAVAVGGESATAGRASLERPKRADHGDYATNLAMLLAPKVGGPPREVAEKLAVALNDALGDLIDRVDVAGPGFLNLFLTDRWYVSALGEITAAGERHGRTTPESPMSINVEFVSANPTGPLHVGHARNAAYGDALSRLFEFSGHSVVREYYVNDFGSQIARLAESVQARARGEDVTEDGYQGDYVQAVADAIADADTLDLDTLGQRAVELMRERIAASLRAFGVEFDVWFSERSLHQPAGRLSGRNPVSHAFERLDELGESFWHDDALWLRTSAHGDDKDRVLVRASGEHTYFASDLGYMLDKRERAFDRLIYVLGADHHGYMARMLAAYECLGGDRAEMDLLVMQFVHLISKGERSSMSKRSGEFVTLDDLIAEIGTDAARWYLLQRSHDTTIDLDLDMARKESSENPVYYVQYAHARIASMLVKAGDDVVAAALAQAHEGLELHPSERALIAKLLTFGAEVAEAADRRSPHRVATFALELAQTFTAFYRDCPVLGADDPAVRDARITLLVATQRTIASALDVLGVSAPQQMSRDDE